MATFRSRWWFFIAISLAGAFFPNFAKAGPPKPAVAEIIVQRLDPGIKPEVKQIIINDFVRLSQYQMKIRPDSLFAHVFGSNGCNGVIDFILRRISYVLPFEIGGEIKIRDRFKRETSFSAEFKGKIAKSESYVPFLMRVNLWSTGEQLRVGSIVVPSDSPVAGLIRLGDRFLDEKTSIDRVATFIHEARHSDLDIEWIKLGLKYHVLGYEDAFREREDVSKLSKKLTSPTHSVCPPETGHKQTEKYCDKELWKCHTFTAIFLSEIFHSCLNCSDRERQRAIELACYCYGLVVPIVRKIGSAIPAYNSTTEEQRRYVDRAEEFLRTKLNQLDMTPTVNKATWDATVQAFQEFKRQREQHPEEFNASFNLGKP
jgi:hypothetical protein